MDVLVESARRAEERGVRLYDRERLIEKTVGEIEKMIYYRSHVFSCQMFQRRFKIFHKAKKNKPTTTATTTTTTTKRRQKEKDQ